MKRLILTILIAIYATTLHAQRQVININQNWEYIPGWEVEKGVSTTIDLPHMWNADALAGKEDYYRGSGTYLKFIDIPREWKGNRVYIHFKGASQTALLLVNSRYVGTHKGGYSAFTWDITDHLKFGEENGIWVRVTNALDYDVMPLVGDFNIYGGLYRDVELIVVPETHFGLTYYGSKGVFISSSDITEESAKINIEAMIQSKENSSVELTVDIFDINDSIVGSTSRKIKVGNNGRIRVPSKLTLENPVLWQGVENPYLYRAVLTLKGDGTSRNDVVEQHFGIRTVEVTADNRFLLNGVAMKIQGVVRHQDWSGIGNALMIYNHEQDIQIMREMGVNAVRLAFGQHDPYFIEQCDRAGIMVWSEIPFVGPGKYRDKGFIDSPEFKNNGKQQLLEMIHQLYNHPSVVMWGLFNELIEMGDNPIEYVKELNALAKKEDPSRLTVASSNQNGELNFITDIIAFSKNYGWDDARVQTANDWGGSLSDWKNLRAGIGEYGAGGNIYHQSDELKYPNPEGRWHPEQWQTHVHEQYWKIISDNSYFWGTFVWSMFDYGAVNSTSGQMQGVSSRGLVTYDRAVKKDAFYFYKANWNRDEPFVHIADRRLNRRKLNNGKISIKVYSNQPQVDLLINGELVQTKEADGTGIFRWDDLQLKAGRYTVEAFSANSPADMITVEVHK